MGYAFTKRPACFKCVYLREFTITNAYGDKFTIKRCVNKKSGRDEIVKGKSRGCAVYRPYHPLYVKPKQIATIYMEDVMESRTKRNIKHYLNKI